MGRGQIVVRFVGDPRRRDCPQYRQITQSAVRLLQVRLEQMCKFTGAPHAFIDLVTQLRQPNSRGRAPVVEEAAPRGSAQRDIALNDTSIEETEHHSEVIACGITEFGQRAYRMIEAYAAVPNRVPQRIRDCGCAVRAVMDKDEVEVASRRQLASAVSPDRDKSHPAVASAGVVVRRTQPLIRKRDEFVTSLAGRSPEVAEQRLTPTFVFVGRRSEVLRVRRRHVHQCGLARRYRRVDTTPSRHRCVQFAQPRRSRRVRDLHHQLR